MDGKVEACAECTRICLSLHKAKLDPYPIVSSFFKVMFGNRFSDELIVPPRFARNLKSLDGKNTYLEDSTGQKWNVCLSKVKGAIVIQRGWREFSLDHGIELGDFVVFNYVTGSHFSVQIFTKSGCEKPALFSDLNYQNRSKAIRDSNNGEIPPVASSDSGIVTVIDVEDYTIEGSTHNTLKEVPTENVLMEPYFMTSSSTSISRDADRDFLFDLSVYEMPAAKKMRTEGKRVSEVNICQQEFDQLENTQLESASIDVEKRQIAETSPLLVSNEACLSKEEPGLLRKCIPDINLPSDRNMPLGAIPTPVTYESPPEVESSQQPEEPAEEGTLDNGTEDNSHEWSNWENLVEDEAQGQHSANKPTVLGLAPDASKKRKRGRPAKPKVDRPFVVPRKYIYPPMRLYPGRVIELIHNISAHQREWIRQSPWKWVLDLKINKLDRFFMTWLTRRWNYKTCKLKIRDDYFVKIDDEMIGRVLGLPYGGNKFIFEKRLHQKQYLKLKEEYEGLGGVNYNIVYNACILEVQDRTKFMRHFIFYVLGIMLCTTKCNYASPQLLKIVFDEYVSESSKWNWSQFILEWMVKFSGSDAAVNGVEGSAMVLLIVYLDRLNIWGNKGHRWGTDTPRLSVWQQLDVEKAIAADRCSGANDQFGKAEVVKNVVYGKPYPGGSSKAKSLHPGEDSPCVGKPLKQAKPRVIPPNRKAK